MPTTPPPEPDRPPAPSAPTPTTRVCPDCIRDPDHHSPGGVRPISEFRLFTGKAARRYKHNRRWSAYCRYHLAVRSRAAHERRKTMGSATSLTPAQRLRRAEAELRSRASGRRKRASQRERERARKRKSDAPTHGARRKLRVEQTKIWAKEHAAERKAYRAQWYLDKVDKEIAAGLRPPHGTPYKGARVGPSTLLLTQGRFSVLMCVGANARYEVWRDYGLPTAHLEWTRIAGLSSTWKSQQKAVRAKVAALDAADRADPPAQD